MGTDLEPIVESACGRRVVERRSVGGGCINEAVLFTLDDGERVFAKTHANAGALPNMFSSEAAGLAALADADSSLYVPRPIDSGPDYIVMEAIAPAPGSALGSEGGLAEKLGQGLAELHRGSARDRYGFDCDNYLGATPQANGWMDEWLAFWAERRFKPMLALVRDEGELDRLGAKLLDGLDTVLDGPDEPSALLHGDLWSGNATMDAQGRAVIFDPAAYWGHREAEFGMTRLFGFGSRFEAAYEAVYPLAAGAARRIKVYTLHHVLNHLHLFGGGYYDSSVRLLREIV